MIPVADLYFLIDANVHIDVFEHDPIWSPWSESVLASCRERGTLVINPIIYAELAAGFASEEALDAALPPDDFERHDLPWDAAFLAGQCFNIYRRRGGVQRAPMPDFYIGAHAAVMGFTLVTRDATRYRSYFPRLDIIAP